MFSGLPLGHAFDAGYHGAIEHGLCLLGELDVGDTAVGLDHKGHFAGAVELQPLCCAGIDDVVIEKFHHCFVSAGELRHLFYHFGGGELRPFDGEIGLIGIVMDVLVYELAAVDLFAVVRSVNADGGGDRAAIDDDGRGVFSAGCGGNFHCSSTYGNVFAFEAVACLDRFEVFDLFVDFGADFLYFLVNKIAQYTGNDGQHEENSEEDHPHAPIALAGLLAEHVSAVLLIAVFEHQVVPLARK